jgi:ornithine cyclodeaminase
MSVRILTGDDVARLLPMRECVDVMASALEATSRGDAVLPLRQVTWQPDSSGLLGVMPAYLGQPRCIGLKAITVTPANHGTELDAHQGAVLLFEAERGRLVAMMDATAITRIRTAAVSGVATRALAREDARDLAILGSGVQASSHLEAMLCVRPIRRARAWSRNAERARDFARRETERHGIEVVATRTAAEAVEGADVVCTTTSAREPVLQGEWLAPGAHVNAVGACLPAARELDTAAVVRSRLYVDRRESAFAEAGDVIIPLREGAITEEHVVGELGDVLLGRVAGRRTADEITLFESLGIAVEDLAAAHHVHRRAAETGAGIVVDLGGRR